MKKTLLFLIIASMMWVLPLYAADTKITELTEDTAPTSDDLVPTVNAPGTSPANRKATLANLFKWALVPGGSTNVTTITGNYAFGITLTDTTNVTFPTSGTLATTEGTLASTVLDDTKGNGDTAFVWSADKVYDQLALKQNADADLTAIAALSCSQDQIIKKGASAWECGTDNDSAGTPTTITVADTTDTTSYVALFESATGDLGPKTDAGITYNAGTGMLTVTGLTTGSGGVTTAATAAPTYLFSDSDAPGADKEIAKIVGGYVDGADGSENGTLDFNVHQAGTTTSYVQLDGKNVQVEITKPLVLLSSDDPDTSAANQMTFDTDGWLRVYSTSQKALARIQEEIHVTVYKPNDMDDAQRDHFWIWSNESGMSFIVTGWKGWSTSDDTTLTIYEEDADGANDATVDAVEIATGSGPYTGSDTTITGATIENGHLVYLDFDNTDAPAMVKLTIYGYYNADVN